MKGVAQNLRLPLPFLFYDLTTPKSVNFKTRSKKFYEIQALVDKREMVCLSLSKND